MGCGSSKLSVVEPVKPGSVDVNEAAAAREGPRGDSAVSRKTTDSGVGLDPGDATALPVPRILPPLRAQSPGMAHETERPDSSVILEQLLSQGIIPAQPKVGGGGEAYNIMLNDADRPRRRPPPRLESLKTRNGHEVTRKDIEEKMKQVEERRKVREEELRSRLRAKSARPRGAAPDGVDDAGASMGRNHSPAPPTPHLPEPDGEPREGGSGGRAADGRWSDSPELENDSTFQKIEDVDEFF
ncbi:uncharacterized protein stmnd1 [Brachyhypopomus gauderio]|uniref:uncharacterized protein stmnd1 n=1 Tax=Brachyhypopomus gauderio TaxID=698409 RepID=UPI00404199E4